MPHRASTPFYRLVLDALSDKTLIILMIAAAVSIAIGIYEDVSKSKDPADNPDGNQPGSWLEGIVILITGCFSNSSFFLSLHFPHDCPPTLFKL